jgi:O-antigen/teichoic acid export membrane protein
MVLASNFVVLTGSILIGFVLPKLLGVVEYGYYKIFALYLGYVGLFHFGFVDGILLSFAGTEYAKLPKEKFKRYSNFFAKFQMAISSIIIFITLFFLRQEYKYMFVLLGIDMFAQNLIMYFQYISQSTMRFKELSLKKILLTFSKILLIFLMWLLQRTFSVNVDANWYITGMVLIDIVLVSWYVLIYRDIVFGQKFPLSNCLKDIKKFFKQGIILTIAYQAAHLVFSLDRQYVSIIFDTKVYGVYSFAYNIISLVTTVIGSVSLVLFPRLKQMKPDSLMQTYSSGLAVISIVALGTMVVYQPLGWFIRWYLPDYSMSVEYLKIIFPGLAISCCISIIMFTYFKALNAHFQYFINCCIVLLIGILTNTLAVYLFHSPESVSVASIFTLLVWYLINEFFFVKNYGVPWKKNFFYIVLVMIAFYLTNIIVESKGLACVLYCFLFFIITVFFYKDLLSEIMNRAFKNLNMHNN